MMPASTIRRSSACRERTLRTRCRRCIVALAILVALAGALAGQGPSEFQIKAAYLLNFSKFVEWSPGAFSSSDSPIAICILGKDPFGRNLDDIVQGEIVNGHIVVVRRLTQIPAPKTCQIAYIDASEKEIASMLRSLGPDVLTVGDGERFLRDGGMIAFVLDNRRVRFDISQAAAQSGSLKLSSRLLNVARVVQK